METSVMDNAKKLTKYPSLYLVKGSQGSIRTNSTNANEMPSVDITEEKLMVRYGSVEPYQMELNGESTHIIAIYLEDGHSSLFIDGQKVVENGEITYIKDLQQLILTTNRPGGIEYFAAYEDCQFSDEELIKMTQLK